MWTHWVRADTQKVLSSCPISVSYLHSGCGPVFHFPLKDLQSCTIYWRLQKKRVGQGNQWWSSLHCGTLSLFFIRGLNGLQRSSRTQSSAQTLPIESCVSDWKWRNCSGLQGPREPGLPLPACCTWIPSPSLVWKWKSNAKFINHRGSNSLWIGHLCPNESNWALHGEMWTSVKYSKKILYSCGKMKSSIVFLKTNICPKSWFNKK